MSINFGSRAPSPAPAQPQDTGMEVVPYNIQDDRAQMTQALTGTKEVDDIVSTIEVYNLETIVGRVCSEYRSSRCSWASICSQWRRSSRMAGWGGR